MAKAQYLIEMAYTAMGLKAIGEPLSGDDLNYGLLSLNSLLDSWQADNLNIPFVTELAQTVTGSPLTIGTGQTINIAVPAFIRNTSFVRSGGVDSSIKWLSESDYNSIAIKGAGATFPLYGYFDGAFPVGKIYLYPAPKNSELHLILDATLPTFAEYTTDYAIDKGYESALYLSLAERLCLGIKNVPDDLRMQAGNARNTLRINNTQVNTLRLSPSVLGGARGRYYAL